MAIKTGIIRYNLKDRGYKAHGQPRNFNIPMLVDSINGAATQERVKGRGMLGFFGHWPRVKFGLWGAEGGMDGGKALPVEPAIVTTHLKAYPDGTVEHEAEFLTETNSGKVAANMFLSRVGGFSSVIDEVRGLLMGFDWVNDPNYRSNRGYALDFANGMALDSAAVLTLDAVDTEIRDEQLHAMAMIMDASNSEREQANRIIGGLEAQVEDLLSLLAKQNPAAVAAFDSAQHGGYQPAKVISYDSAAVTAMMDRAREFTSASLERFETPAKNEGQSILDRTIEQTRRTVRGW